MKKVLFVLSTVLFLITLFSVSNAQGKFGVVGKMFGKQEANNLYGKVNNSVTINVKDLQNALNKAGDYILIGIKNGVVILRNDQRIPIGNESESVERNFVLYRFSKSMVEQLLKSTSTTKTLSAASSANIIIVELRASVLTLSNSEETLEMALPCPPLCND